MYNFTFLNFTKFLLRS